MLQPSPALPPPPAPWPLAAPRQHLPSRTAPLPQFTPVPCPGDQRARGGVNSSLTASCSPRCPIPSVSPSPPCPIPAMSHIPSVSHIPTVSHPHGVPHGVPIPSMSPIPTVSHPHGVPIPSVSPISTVSHPHGVPSPRCPIPAPSPATSRPGAAALAPAPAIVETRGCEVGKGRGQPAWVWPGRGHSTKGFQRDDIGAKPKKVKRRFPALGPRPARLSRPTHTCAPLGRGN